MRVLAIGAHPDDVELGAGATLARHADEGDDVHIFVLGMGRSLTTRVGNEAIADVYAQSIAAAGLLGARVEIHTFPDQQFDTLPLLKITQIVEDQIRRVRPQRIYTHHAGDLNLDHALTHRAVMTAARPVNGNTVARIDCFEVPSATEWGDAPFHPNVFVDVSGPCLERKLAAFACYADEVRQPPHPRALESLRHLARVRGSMAGVNEAEAFQLVREIR